MCVGQLPVPVHLAQDLICHLRTGQFNIWDFENSKTGVRKIAVLNIIDCGNQLLFN